MVSALWSDGPAPPRRLSSPAFGSTSRTPKVCNSLISSSVGRVMGLSIGNWVLNGRRGFKTERFGWAGVQRDVDQFGPRIMADGVHHALALHDQAHVEIGDHHALALGQRRRGGPPF